LGLLCKGNLIVTPEVIGIGDLLPRSALIPLASVQSIEVSGGQVAKSKVGSVVAFGVLGLAAKGAKNESAVVVRIADGETAYYQVDYESPVKVRALVTPILKAAGVPLKGEGAAATPSSPSPAPISVADELAKLASLRNNGILSDEEFEAQKAKLLARDSLRAGPPLDPADLRQQAIQLQADLWPDRAEDRRSAAELLAAFARYDPALLRRALLGDAGSGSAGRDLLADAPECAVDEIGQ